MLFERPITALDFFIRDIILAILYLLSGIVVPLGLMVLALETAKHAAVDYVYYIVVGSALIGMGSVYFFIHRRKRTPEEKALEQKLKDLLGAGKVLVKETTVALTREDIGKLRKLKFWITLASIPVMGIPLYIVYQATMLFSYPPLNLFITAGIGVLFAILIYKFVQQLHHAIEKGEKSIVRGIITRKYYSQGLGFTIVIGNLRFRFQRYTYLASDVGDEVEMEVLRSFGNVCLKRRTISKVN